jgi:2-keto-myo-inositol isomerase
MKESLDRCEKIFKLSKELECDIVVVNPNEFAPSMKKRTEVAFDSFITKASQLSSEYSVKLGYEFVAYENRIVNTLAESLKGLQRWDSEERVGLVLDIFHLFRTGEELTQIPQGMRNRVWIFHVNDAPSLPLPVLKDTDRVFPGEGIVNVKKALEELEKAGFSGPVSLELFNQSYWNRPGSQVLGESWDRLQRVMPSTSR